jgi:phage head maturation protease
MSTPNGERDLAIKTFGALEIKDAEKGEVEAIVATLNTVDRDREVILPGAIPDGSKVKLSAYGHGSMFGEMPVGKGALHVEKDKAVFRGKFFLSTSRGADAFRTLKELGTDQEWSFGFRVISAENATEDWAKQGAFRVLKKLEPFEVSPVLMGAGIGTRTVAMKCDGCGEPQEGATCAPCAAKAAREADEQAAAGKAAAEAEAARLAAEATAAEASRLAADAALKQAAAEEFEKFQRTARRLGGG